jgi:hypothetical protein
VALGDDRGRRTPGQWAALGLLAGVMGTMRWQNVLFALLPAVEWVGHAIGHWRMQSRRELLVDLRHGLLFVALAVVGLLPQLLAWKAIYGTWFAVSPISPQIRLWDSHWDEVLWSSRNGLFAMSPILYVGAFGLLLLWRRDRLATLAALTVLGVMVFLNGAVQTGGAAPRLEDAASTRRFRCWCWEPRWRWSDRPRGSPSTPGSWWACRTRLVIWNLTLMEAAIGGALQLEAPMRSGPSPADRPRRCIGGWAIRSPIPPT